jgi:hypothetical protein
MTAGLPEQKRLRSRRSKFCNPEFYLILTTSGSEGWHLFVCSAEFHPVEHWVRLLKQVADKIGAEIKTGICEIFPHETRNRSRPHAIRAPGTWNPKTNQLGAVFYESIGLFFRRRKSLPLTCDILLHDNGNQTCGGNPAALLFQAQLI